jgi:signal transduction histidine kinase
MKKSFSLIFLIFSITIWLLFPHTITGKPTDKTDDLEVKLILADDTAKMTILFELIEIYLTESPSKALTKAEIALKLSKDLNQPALEAKSLRLIGLSYKHLISDYDKALSYCYKALKIEETHHLSKSLINTLLALGEIYEDIGNYTRAQDYYMQALISMEQAGSSHMVSTTLNKIGNINSFLGYYDKAMDYHQQALQHASSLNDTQQEANAIFYLAEVYKHQKNFEEAEKHHFQALGIRKENNDKKLQAESLDKIGQLFRMQGNHKKALEYFEKSVNIRKQENDIAGQATSHYLIGSLYLAQKDYSKALSHVSRSLKFAEEINEKKIMRDTYESLYAIHLALKNHEKALHYKDLFAAINDFIYSEESNREIAEMQSRFEIEKKQSEIEVLKKSQEITQLEIAKQKNFRNFLIISLVLFLIIAVLLFYLYKLDRKNNKMLTTINEQINKKNNELQDLNATKDKFFSIIAHDLKGPLNSFTSFSNLLINYIDSLSKEEIQMLASDLDKSIKNLFSLLENLLEWARSQTGALELKPENIEIKALAEANKEILQKSADNKEIKLMLQVPDGASAFADKNYINTVIRNLLSNAIKFTTSGGTVSLEVEEFEDAVEVAVRDTGVGMSPEVQQKIFRIDQKHSTNGTANEKGTGLGLVLCKEFVEKNGGCIWVESEVDKGTVFRFTIPKSPVSKENQPITA